MPPIKRLPNIAKLTKSCVVCGGTGLVRKHDRYADKHITVHCAYCSGTGFVRPSAS